MIVDSMSFDEIADEIMKDMKELTNKVMYDPTIKRLQKQYAKSKRILKYPCVYSTCISFKSKRKNQYLLYTTAPNLEQGLTPYLFCSYLHKGKRSYVLIRAAHFAFHFLSHHFVSRCSERNGTTDFIYVVKEILKMGEISVTEDNIYLKSSNVLAPIKIIGDHLIYLTYMNDLNESNKKILNS